jgi:hypothetical protein
VILVLPIVGILYSTLRIATRTTRAAWRRTEGSPPLRLGFVVLAAVLVGALVYSWIPTGNYREIRKGERGTLGEGIAEIRRLPSGKAPLVPLQRAEQQSSTESPSTTLTTQPDENGTTTTTPFERTSTTLRGHTSTTLDTTASTTPPTTSP